MMRKDSQRTNTKTSLEAGRSAPMRNDSNRVKSKTRKASIATSLHGENTLNEAASANRPASALVKLATSNDNNDGDHLRGKVEFRSFVTQKFQRSLQRFSEM